MTLSNVFKILAAVFALALLTVGPAAADTVMYSTSFPSTPTDFGATLDLPQWNPAAFPGYVLTGIEVDFSIAENVGNITTTNEATNPESFSLQLTSSVTTGGPLTTDPPTALSPDPLVLTLWSSPSINLAGVGSGPLLCTDTLGNPPGCNEYSYNPGVVNGSSSVVLSDSSLFGPYAGSGDFTLTANTTSGSNFTGGGNNIGLSITDTATLAASVTYTYEESSSPEPASMLLSGGALLGLGALLRKRKSQTVR